METSVLVRPRFLLAVMLAALAVATAMLLALRAHYPSGSRCCGCPSRPGRRRGSSSCARRFSVRSAGRRRF
jgi:hypothetical protein